MLLVWPRRPPLSRRRKRAVISLGWESMRAMRTVWKLSVNGSKTTVSGRNKKKKRDEKFKKDATIKETAETKRVFRDRMTMQAQVAMKTISAALVIFFVAVALYDSDGFAGFKELYHYPNIALALSTTGKLELGKVYEAPEGWHWGSKAEVDTIMDGGWEAQMPWKFYCRAGWDMGWQWSTW